MKRIGLFGFGQVGQGLFNIIRETNYKGAKIEKIAVKNRVKNRLANAELFVFDKNDILNDPNIDIVVEAIDNADEAFEIVKSALEKGKAVVTANKKMIAEHFEDLIDLQALNNTPILYEGSVCGAIPIIQNIEKYFSHEELKSVQGIFNGTSNYILSKIFTEKLDYKTALKQAQELGFAESDPTSDVQGFDAKFKTIILAKHSFGVLLKPKDVINYGIDTLSETDIQFARDNKQKIKVLPTILNEKGNIFSFVLPHFVQESSLFYTVENEFNAVQIEAPYTGTQFFYGRGAGSLPTGAAVFNDVQDIVRGQFYPYSKGSNHNEAPSDELFIEIYLRYTQESVKDSLEFEHISRGYISPEYSYIVGLISLQNLALGIDKIRKSKSTIIATGRREFKARPFISSLVLNSLYHEEARLG